MSRVTCGAKSFRLGTGDSGLGTYRILCVLAGGRSRRFGSPKLALRIDDEPLLLRHLRRLSSWADECWLSAAPGQALPSMNAYARTFVDEHPFAGPLHAVRQILRAAADHALIAFVPGDMPLVDAVHLRRLETSAAITMGRWEDGGVEPFPCLCRVGEARRVVEWACATGGRSVQRLAAHLAVCCMPLKRPGDGLTYLNINRPDDLARFAGRGAARAKARR